MARIKESWPHAANAMPQCNVDFGNLVVGGKAVQDKMSKGAVQRANLVFDFLSPTLKEIESLKKQYAREPEVKNRNEKIKKRDESMAKGSGGIEYTGLPDAKGSLSVYKR